MFLYPKSLQRFLLPIIISFSFILFSTSSIEAQDQWFPDLSSEELNSMNFFDVIEEYDRYFDTLSNRKGQGYKPYQRAKYFWMNRVDKNGNYPDLNKAHREIQDFYRDFNRDKNPSPLSSSPWKQVGPRGGHSPNWAGRINAIEFHPTNQNTIWIGASGGGIWKTTNGGQNWTPATGSAILSMGISDIAVSKSSPTTVFAATGDGNGPSGMGAYYSYGILKSLDGGNTWQLLNPFGAQLQQSNQARIYKIIVHPNNERIVYFASNLGFYKSVNGGASWTQLREGLIRDIKMHPTKPNQIVGAISSGNNYQLFQYNDATSSFDLRQIVNAARRVTLTFSHLNPNYVFALGASANGGFNSFYRSTDEGVNWELMSSPSTLNVNPLHLYFTGGFRQGGQGTYDLAIEASPNNLNEVFIGGINVWKTTNGGTSFVPVTDGYNNSGLNLPFGHPDVHIIRFNHNVASKPLYVGNDGGIILSTNNGANFSDLSGDLSITEHSRFSVHPTNAGILIAGSQDNGTKMLNNSTWRYATGGDGMSCLINPGNPNIVLTSSQYGTTFYSGNGGANFSNLVLYGRQSGYSAGSQGYTNENAYWCAPITHDPSNPNIIYAGHQNVWKSTNAGASFTRLSNFGRNNTLMYITVAPSNGNYIYVAYAQQSHPTFSNRSFVERSTDGGVTWNQYFTHPNESVSGITVHPSNPNRIYVALSGYSSGQKVVEVNGTDIINLSSNLPNIPVNCVVYQNGSPDRLFIGTDAGVYSRDNSGNNWTVYGTEMPPAIINDLQIHYPTGKLFAASYGRGIWEIPVIDCQLDQPTISSVNGNFTGCQGTSITLEINTDAPNILWSNGARTKRVEVTTSGQYFVTISDNKGCTSVSESINVNFIDKPNLEIFTTSGESALCQGDSLEVSVRGFFSDIVWSDGQTGRRVFIKQAGSISATAKDLSGVCEVSSNTLQISSKSSPQKPTITVENRVMTANGAGVSFQWYLNGTAINGATTRTFTPLEDGDYVVASIGTNGCQTVSDLYSYQASSVVKEIEGFRFVVAPNPFEENVSISGQSSIDGNVRISIVDILGNEVLSKQLNDVTGQFNVDFNLENLTSGTYVLQVKTNTQSTVRKLIKR